MKLCRDKLTVFGQRFLIKSETAMLSLLFVKIHKNYTSRYEMKHALRNCSEWQRQQGKGSNPNECQQISFDRWSFSNCSHSWPPFGGPWGPAPVSGAGRSKISLRMVGKGKTGTSLLILILICLLVNPCLLCQVTLPIPIPVAPGTVFCATQSCERAKF